MQIFNYLNEWCIFRKTLLPQASLGFVPTMGNLHRGHASLFSKSLQENDRTVASIFVNPTQFNLAEDFTHYPRTLDDDLALLEELGVDYCLLPSNEEIYADDFHYQIQENSRCQLMEGQHRPGHFNGVLTIVMKLLNLVKPRQAYFGEKDYQQFQLIRGMANAFFMPIAIIPCPTIRESSGLAYSSRNNRLTEEQREIANQFATVFHQKNQSCETLISALRALDIGVEYLEEHDNRRFVAVKIGAIRLIDNYAL